MLGQTVSDNGNLLEIIELFHSTSQYFTELYLRVAYSTLVYFALHYLAMLHLTLLHLTLPKSTSTIVASSRNRFQ